MTKIQSVTEPPIEKPIPKLITTFLGISNLRDKQICDLVADIFNCRLSLRLLVPKNVVVFSHV